MTSPLSSQIHASPGAPASVRVGMVSAQSPPEVSLQGTVLEDVGFLQSYVPRLGDPVVLLGQSSSVGVDPSSWLVLGASGGVAAMRMPAAVVKRNAVLPVPTGFGDTFVPFDGEIFDNFDMFTATSTDVVVPFDGVYQVNVLAAFAANATGVRIAILAVNGASTGREQVLTNVGGSLATSVSVSDAVFLSAGDRVQMIVKQNSGVSLNVNTAWLSLFMVTGV